MNQNSGRAPKAVVQAIHKADNPIVLTHTAPDGDAIGSALGIAALSRSLGAEPRVLVTAKIDAAAALIDPDQVLELATRARPGEFARHDLAILCDAPDPSRTGPLEIGLNQVEIPLVIIDHHVPAAEPGELAWVDCDAAATAQMVYELFQTFERSIDRSTAQALFLGIASDTGWFRHSNTTSRALAATSHLVELGAEPEALYRTLYEQDRVEVLKLRGLMLGEARVLSGGRAIFGVVTQQNLSRFSVAVPEVEGFVDSLRRLRDVDLVCFAVETEPGYFRVSLRSQGSTSVRPIAVRFGGGGHERASGFTYRGRLEELVSRLEAEYHRHAPPA